MSGVSIVGFLLARLAEDVAVVDEAGKADGQSWPRDHALSVLDDDYRHDTIVVEAPRVLRDVEMCRKLIAAHVDYYGDESDHLYPIPTLSLLAERYSTHDDYDPAWALDTAEAST